MNAEFYPIPSAVERLGTDLFLELPLYKSIKPSKPIYINFRLFHKFFTDIPNADWEQMSNVIERFFSVTLSQENSTHEILGKAYVDKQSDPLNLALSGNLGSGRAYYLGNHFNIKGEKTPLATSDKKIYSDGFLEIERGIWETTIANSLQGSLETGIFEVLAILDTGENCEVTWRENKVRRVKIIRVDTDGRLDRVTHHFYKNTPINSSKLLQVAHNFGKLEADKFIERILHGSWSAGNISLDGHFIDCDTAVSVIGRAPQYIFSQWHHENYFGYEYKGQLKVLEALSKSSRINYENVKFEELESNLLTAMNDHTALRFIDLMGFKNREKIYKKFKDELNDLTTCFVALSKKCSAVPESLYARYKESTNHHFYDFSAFFRIYPILKRYNENTVEKATNLGTDEKIFSEIKFLIPEMYQKEFKGYLFSNVFNHFENNFIKNSSDINKAALDLIGFIYQYDNLFSNILDYTKQNLAEIEVRAYKINEDRHYLLLTRLISYQLTLLLDKTPNSEISFFIDLIIRSSQRAINSNEKFLISDLRIYKEGYTYLKLSKVGSFQRVIHVFKRYVENKITMANTKVYADNIEIDYTIETKNLTYKLTSYAYDNKILCHNYSRQLSLNAPIIEIKNKKNLVFTLF